MKRINEMLERRKEDAGFTLIELMVVVLIIGILIAIAIPTFLGARARAQDRAAQSSLRNAVTSAKTIYTDKEDYADADVAALTSSEPSLTFQTAASGGPKVVSVGSETPVAPSTKSAAWDGAVLSDTGTCWYVRDGVNPSTNPGTHWAKEVNATAANCTAAYAIAHPPTGADPGTANAI